MRQLSWSKNDTCVIKNPSQLKGRRERTHRLPKPLENVLSSSLLILSIAFLSNKIPYTRGGVGGEGWGWGFQSQGTGLKESKRGVVDIGKSIQNDADIMLISVNISTMSLTESDTVFRVTSKEGELHGPVVPGPVWTQ